jgi:hypothetical protein
LARAEEPLLGLDQNGARNLEFELAILLDGQTDARDKSKIGPTGFRIVVEVIEHLRMKGENREESGHKDPQGTSAPFHRVVGAGHCIGLCNEFKYVIRIEFRKPQGQ